MKKFIVISGIFENFVFNGKIQGNRVVNTDSVGQSFPVENCNLYSVEYGTIIKNNIVIQIIELEDKTFLYGLRLLNKKGEIIKGWKGAGGTKNLQELNEILKN